MAVTTFIASRFATTAVATSQRQQQRRRLLFSSTQKSSSVALSSSTFHNQQSTHVTQKKRTQTIIARADVDKGGNASTPTPSTATPKTKPSHTSNFLSELPRGDRKKIDALGKSILLFWYRDSICAIESRSPSEGAYSEGFEKARLTQDACIECPTTKST